MFFTNLKNDPGSRTGSELDRRAKPAGPQNRAPHRKHGPVASFPQWHPSFLKEVLDLSPVGFTGAPVSITGSPVSQLEMPGRKREALPIQLVLTPIMYSITPIGSFPDRD